MACRKVRGMSPERDGRRFNVPSVVLSGPCFRLPCLSGLASSLRVGDHRYLFSSLCDYHSPDVLSAAERYPIPFAIA